MIKKLAIIVSVMTIPMILNGMKLELQELKGSTVGAGSESRRPEGSKPDITLNLDSIPEPLSTLKGKPSIKSLKQVQHLQKQKNTYRESTGRGSEGQKKGIRESGNNRLLVESNQLLSTQVGHGNNSDTEEGIFETDPLHQGGVRLRHKTRSALGGELSLQHESYSSEEMWAMVKKVNPRMYDYATENHLSLDEVQNCDYDFDAINPQIYVLLRKLAKKEKLPLNVLMEYALLSDNNIIEPEAIGELLQEYHGYSDNYTALLVKELKGIEKKNPDEYLSLAVDFITRTCDDDGLKELSPINKKHAAIQKKMLSDAEIAQRNLWIALAGVAVPALLAVPGWILSAVQYFIGQNTTATG